MSRFPMRIVLAVIAAALLGLALAGCGGGSESSADQEGEAVAEVETVATATETEADEAEPETGEAETTADEPAATTDASGPAPAPGKGSLVLDDGRVFALTVSECEFQPNGTFQIDGTSDKGSTFEVVQFYLGDKWSQSSVNIVLPNSDQVYVIVSNATEGAEPITVDGKTLSWTQTFRELDESANRHVYTGQGTVQVTCA